MTPGPLREAAVDLDAITANTAAIRAATGTPAFMAVVKADGYGHGAVPAALAAIAGGADWLGVADVAEAIALRDAGIAAPVLAWLHDPEEDFAAAVAAGVTIGVSSEDQLRAVAAVAGPVAADVHLKLDTGLSRNGIPAADWPRVLEVAAELRGRVRVDGIFSHLSNASPDEDAAQRSAFAAGLAAADAHGIRPRHTHLAATAAAIGLPDTRFSLVRIGIGLYGLPPGAEPLAEVDLVPAMTLRTRVIAVRDVAAGTGASYDLTWRAERPTRLALVPLGYADGIPRQASGRAEVAIGGRRHPVVGRIAMDQFIVDVGDAAVEVGATVVVFGDPATGVPGATEWAAAAGTIGYDIVTGIGRRVGRTYGRPS